MRKNKQKILLETTGPSDSLPAGIGAVRKGRDVLLAAWHKEWRRRREGAAEDVH